MADNFQDIHKSFKLSLQALIFNENGEVLILQSSTDQKQWLFPGGRMDAVETDLNIALAREIHEELGLTLLENLGVVACQISKGGHTFAVLYKVKVDSLNNLRLSHEHCNVRWVMPDDESLSELLFYKVLGRQVNKVYSK